MKSYPDTNFIVALYLMLNESSTALELMGARPEGFALPVSELTELEVINAIQCHVFQSKTGTATVRVTPEAAAMAQAGFRADLSHGVLLKRAVEQKTTRAKFEEISLRHTAKHGFRTYDILHVASALALGCDTFWSFDSKAKKLAKLEGLKTN